MAVTTTAHPVSKSAQIRARLNHPIFDSDGHTIENPAVLAEYIRSESGSKVLPSIGPSCQLGKAKR